MTSQCWYVPLRCLTFLSPLFSLSPPPLFFPSRVSPFLASFPSGLAAMVKLCIDGEWYDLTKWAPHHPGGTNGAGVLVDYRWILPSRHTASTWQLSSTLSSSSRPSVSSPCSLSSLFLLSLLSRLSLSARSSVLLGAICLKCFLNLHAWRTNSHFLCPAGCPNPTSRRANPGAVRRPGCHGPLLLAALEKRHCDSEAHAAT